MEGASEIIRAKLHLNDINRVDLRSILQPNLGLGIPIYRPEDGVNDRVKRYYDVEARDKEIEKEFQTFKRTFAQSNHGIEGDLDYFYHSKKRKLASERKLPVRVQEPFTPVLPTRFRYLEVNTYLLTYPLENRPRDSRMPPFIVHGVSEEERYVGEDGVQRPYGMAFQDTENNGSGGFGSRSSRKVPQETGSFGKSTRRSRSRTGTPAPRKQEDPTLAAADKIFGNFFAEEAARKAATPNRSPSRSSNQGPQLNQSINSSHSPTEVNGSSSRQYQAHKEPTEVVLRGYQAGQEYAAIAHYERIAGRICEDYARDAPLEERRYQSTVDTSAMRRKPLSPEEKAKAMRFAGGDNWIKITFESAPAAEVAIESSPQVIHGYNVFAELYRGVAPTETSSVPQSGARRRSVSKIKTPRRTSNAASSTRSQAATSHDRGGISLSPPVSHSSSNTLDTATISHSSTTITNTPAADAHLYCTAIPTARRVVLLPAELALLPQPSFNQRILSRIPILNWLSADVIGNQVPLTETGEFDWKNASLYWRFVYWLDGLTGWFDIVPEQHEHQE